MEEPPAQSFINPTLEKGSLVLVTGATGFVASHCADQLLEAGYNVRGTVRSEEKAAWLHTLFNGKYGPGRFSTAVVPDMSVDDAFDAAVVGVSGIIHAASVMTFSPEPDTVIPQTVKGALSILTAATKEPTVKSLVYTSSSTAAITPQAWPASVLIDENTWNDEAVRVAGSAEPNGLAVYGASKTEAERAIWKAVEASRPPFQVSAVLPGAVFGDILKPGGEGESSTASMLINLFRGDVFFLLPQWFIDARDTARLHVIALIDRECAGKRVFAFAEQISRNRLLAAFRLLYPGKQFVEDEEGVAEDQSRLLNHDAVALLRKHYGKAFTPLEESVKENTATVAAS